MDKILDKLPPLDKKNLNYVLGGILLTIVLVYYFAILGPQLKTLRTVSPKVTILRQDIQKAKEDSQKIGKYRKDVEKFEKELNVLSQRIKTKEDIPLVLENISLIANSNKLEVDQMMPLVESQELLLKGKDGKYFALPILVEARSSYHNFGRFLNEVELKGSPLSVEKFTITASKTNRMMHSVRLTLTAVVFEEATKDSKK